MVHLMFTEKIKLRQDKKVPRIAVMGGDKRELILIKKLVSEGFEVAAFAVSPTELADGAIFCEEAIEALQYAMAVVLPAPPLGETGELYTADGNPVTLTEEDFAWLSPGTPVVCGVVSPYLKKIGDKFDLNLHEMLELDEIAIPYSLPTAEGAIAIAIAEDDGVLENRTALILGFGRIGQTLAPRLEGMGMDVIITNRNAKRRDIARLLDYNTVDWQEWPISAARADFIFNTVPAMLLDAPVISGLKKTVIIIDLAARPGGTDFEAAAEQGIKAILAGGLPGKFAPGFAGEIMANVYTNLLKNILQMPEVQS